MSDQIIARVSQSLAKEQSLESLVRQLLEMLRNVVMPRLRAAIQSPQRSGTS
ncbi:hypothetical protein ACUOCP_53395, partial [Escherichia sp. R-CC3]